MVDRGSKRADRIEKKAGRHMMRRQNKTEQWALPNGFELWQQTN